jgi:hypothetical protein
MFSRQCFGNRRIPDLATLRRESRAWNRRVNRARVKINWKFNRRAARRKFGYKKTLLSGQRPSYYSVKKEQFDVELFSWDHASPPRNGILRDERLEHFRLVMLPSDSMGCGLYQRFHHCPMR